MTDLKFECPACGQHMECDRVCGGDVIHCPKCCAELRIPFPTSKTVPGSIERAQLLHPAASLPHTQGSPSKSDAPEPSTPAVTAAQVAEVLCPVCQSQLRINPGIAAKAGN